MKISAAFLFVFLQVSLFSQNSPAALQSAPEICNNGIDDDADGLIDCYDTQDCPCEPVPDCIVTSMPTNFEMKPAWISGPDNVQSTITPIIGNLNPWQDSIPEIVVFKYNNNQHFLELLFFKGDGSDSNNPPSLTVDGGFAEPGLADLDGDGNPELFFVDHNRHIQVYHGFDPSANPPMQWWVSAAEPSNSEGQHVYAADFDSDGISELFAGNEVYALDLSNPGLPQLKQVLKGTGPSGFIHSNNSSTFAADLLTAADCGGDPDCNGLEIAAGYVLYSVDLDPNDGDGVQIKIQRNINTSSGQNFSDGFTAVADLNLDGIPEVVVAGKQGAQIGIYAWNKTGSWKFMPSSNPNPGDHAGILSISNTYDDTENGYPADWPEIITTNNYWIACYNLHLANATPAAAHWWALPTSDILGNAGVSTFDFDGDGVSELVYRDEENLRIMYGGAAPFPAGVNNQRNWNTYPIAGATDCEYPVIADVDGDNQAEIIVTGISYPGAMIPPGLGRLYVMESANHNHRSWMPARDTWNQYAYSAVHINDDLTVPTAQQWGHVEMPAPGSGKRPLNNFLFQVPKYGKTDIAYLPTPDLQLELVSKSCNGTSLNITVRICNKGSVPFRDSMLLSFYRFGNPFSGNAIRGGTYLVRTTPLQPDSCMNYTVVLPNAPVSFYFLVNDAGDTQIPLPGNLVFHSLECNYQNNNIQFSGYPNPTLNLGPDRTGCPTEGHTFIVGGGFAAYEWQDGSIGPLFTASTSGRYWVEATDFCNNVRRDTVEVISGDVIQTVQADACAGSSYLFDGQQIPAGGSQTFQYVSIQGCDSTIVVEVAVLTPSITTESRTLCPGDSTLVFGNYVNAAGSFQQTTANVNGCDSTHTIVVELFPAATNTQESRSICPGDSTLVFGNYVNAAGSFQETIANANGCDSTHTIVVELFPAAPNTQESRLICPGDSTLVFGNYVNAAGSFQQTIANVNGCDSTHTIVVELFPAAPNTQESRSICLGDSTLVFGNYVNTAGSFQQTTANVNGCDSTHTIVVELFPAAPNTQESRLICPGDSALVFGNYVNAAGSFQQTTANVNGCDSTHIIVVELFPAATNTQESRSICPGDSTLVFGNYVNAAGSFQQIIANVNGCDSTHTIVVELFPAAPNTQESRLICPGDSTLVFGNYVNAAGLFQQTTANVNGCDSTHTIVVELFPAAPNTQESRSICPGDSTLVFGNYVNAAGSFQQTTANSNGCDSTHTIVIQIYGQQVLQKEVIQPDCRDTLGKIVLMQQPSGALFSLDGISFSADTVLDHLDIGMYTLYTDYLGCMDTLSFEILPANIPYLDLPADTLLSPGQSALILPFISPAGNYTFDWNPALYLSCSDCPAPLAAPLVNTEYTLVITDASGCTAAKSISIKIRQSSIYAPNVFRPNGGDSNTFFTLFAGPASIDQIETLQIFDRWGNLIFERRHFYPDVTEMGWDGSFRGKTMDAGIYIWQAKIITGDEKTLILHGDVLLLR